MFKFLGSALAGASSFRSLKLGKASPVIDYFNSYHDSLTYFIWLAKSAEVRSVLLFVFSYLIIWVAKAVWVDPFATRAFTLEHHVAWAVLIRVKRSSAETVHCLICVWIFWKVRDPVLLLHLIFQSDKVLHLLRAINIPTQSNGEFNYGLEKNQPAVCKILHRCKSYLARKLLTYLSIFWSSLGCMASTGKRTRRCYRFLPCAQHLESESRGAFRQSLALSVESRHLVTVDSHSHRWFLSRLRQLLASQRQLEGLAWEVLWAGKSLARPWPSVWDKLWPSCAVNPMNRAALLSYAPQSPICLVPSYY